ncbi:5-carboxymethyl-2-hydroxymuconate Delta-isomerase [Paraferrimonas sedimenticola]|uniref:5-carboxymethyl-2-hydroxymuconate isomerase n=1 Tax=Paraferrimonas sedimenticola TaxID=375674 RepID=A0AA37W086_9GAMM|nr:5-carboxymethyl-2-hydroxymuconate Delta-isomerase [Paraferrimonas sedimenticola]GLP95143.1 5-carboxymethyl-2-hydroxymuconate isomerase [Paraferrimonas sedimenticola]
MPHFVMDCSSSILESHSQEFINQQIHAVAVASGLFTEADIKVRVNPYDSYSVGGSQQVFIHVFAHIMQGRSEQQKAQLSKQVVSKLVELFPEVENIAMNVSEFEKATYFKRTMLTDAT